MNQKIDNSGPSGGHPPEAGSSARLSAAAAFRALLGLMRPPARPLADRRDRRALTTAAARGRGGSHAGAETDEAVDASSSNERGGNNRRQRRDPEGDSGGREGATPTSSLLFAALAAQDTTRANPAVEPASTTSEPVIWPAAALPNAWQHADAISPYVPASAVAEINSAPTAAPPYTLWNPAAHGTAALPAVRRWSRAESVSSYAMPVAPTAPRTGAKQYRPFMPLRRPAARVVSTASQRLRPGSWVRAAAIRPFVSPGLVTKGPIQRVRYRRFTPLSSASGPATPNRFKAGHRSRAAAIQPYRSPATFAASPTKRFKMRAYTPPPASILHLANGIALAPSQQHSAGGRPAPMSIDTLVSRLRDRAVAALPRPPGGQQGG
jgi:hypothetical protein